MVRERIKGLKQEDAFELPKEDGIGNFNGVYAPSKELWGEPLPDDKKFPKKDIVNHPDHYASGKLECIDAMEAMTDQGRDPLIRLDHHSSHLWQTIFKYIWRFPFKKSPIEDLKKAEFYLKRLILRLENQKKENK